MPQIKTNTSSLVSDNPILTGLLTKESMPVTKKLKRASNVDLPFPKRGLTLTDAPTNAIASQERLKGSVMKTHLGGMRTGDDSSLEPPVRAGWARNQNEVANLSGGSRPDSRTSVIDLRGRNFTYEDLTNRLYQNFNLGESNFEAAILSGATFKNTILSQCNFRGAVLTNLCCEDVLFVGARVGRTMIKSGHYSGCNFSWAELSNVDCVDVNFSGNNFFSAKLIKVIFVDCDLSGANLTNLDLDDVDFSGANLTDAQMSLSQKFIEETLLGPITSDRERQLNAYCSETGISNLLVTIHSINPTYQNLKNPLMRSVIEQVNRLDDGALQLHLPALVEMLLNNPGYDEVPEIASFNNRLLKLWLQLKQREPYRRGEVDRDLVLKLIKRHPSGVDHLVSNYGKTLARNEPRASFDARTASPSTPAITGGTARS